MADIGAKIKLEGEAEFRKNITNITNQSKALASEMKAVESSFNSETTAQEKATKKAEVLTKQIDVQKQKVALLTDMYQKSAAELGENDNKTLQYKDQLNKAQAALNKMNNELDATEKSVDEYGNEIVEAEKGNEQFTQSVGALLGNEKLKEFFASAADKISEFAGKAVDAAKELDEGYDTIVTKTGATGDALEEMKGIANDVYGSMPVEMADVGAAVGEVNTRFKQSGDQLRDTSEQFLKFARINGTDVSDSIDSVDRVMKIFHVDASDTGNVLGLLTKAAQDSGITVDALTSQLDQNGATFAELGYDVQDAANLMAMFEANGVDTSSVMTALKKSITNAAKEGKDANSVLTDAEKRIKGASSETEALQIATEIFGTRGAVVMVNGLRDGRISLSQTEKSLESYANVVEDTYEATLSPWDKTKVAMNNLKTVASDLAGNALSTLVPAIEKITDVVKKVSDWFNKLPPSGQKVIGVLTAIGAGAAILGPKIMTVVTTLKELKAASDLTKSIQSMGGEMQKASGSASGLSQNIGLIGAAIGITIGAVIAASEAQEAWRIKTDENYAALARLEDETATLASEAQASRGNLDELKTSFGGNSEEVDRLSERLLELNDKQSLTAAESEEYRVIVAKLEQLLPGFSGEIDESTGKLKDQSQATAESIEQLKELAKTAAAQSGLEKAIQASTEASVKQKQALQNMREAMERTGAAVNMTDEELLEAARSATHFNGTIETMMNGVIPLTGETTKLSNTLHDGAVAYDEYSTQITEADALVAEYTAQIEATKTSTDELGTATTTTAEEVTMSAEEMQAAYDQALQSAQKSLTEQAGLFQKFEYDANVSIDSIEQALESQAQAYATWSANATAVMQDVRYGTDINFTAMANTILNMGMEGASYLKTFVDAAQSEDGRLEGVLADFGAASTAQASQANVFASWQQQLVGQTGAMIGAVELATPGMTEAGYQFGAAAPEGTAQGMEDNAGAVEGAAGSLSSKVTTAIENAKATEKAKASGKNIVGGIALGIAGSLPKVVTALNNLQRPIKTLPTTITGMSYAYTAAGRSIISSLASGISTSVGLVTSAMATVKNATNLSLNSSTYSSEGRKVPSGIASGITSNTGVVTAASNALRSKVGKGWTVDKFTNLGAMIDAGIAKGMNNNLAVVKSAATNVAAKAIQAAKDRLKVGSPSKEFEYLGKMSVAGYLGGIENGGVAKAINRTFTLPDAGAAGVVSNSYSSSYGDIVVNVSGANVSDPARLADMVADRINRQVLSRKAAFA